MRRGVPLDAALDRALAPLPEADRRLTHELAAGVLRHGSALDGVLAHFVPRGIGSLSAPLLDVLRLGAYQLRILDRVPAHAAVATSVALARERVGDRVSGFTNAVLRRVAELPAGAATHDALSEVEHLARAWSHPAWLVARWLGRFGSAGTAALLQWNNSRPSLVLQPTRGDVLDLEGLLDEHGIGNAPAPYGAGVVVKASHPERLPGYDAGEFYVQDPAQALVVQFASFPSTATIYDACAAPGGKAVGMTRRSATVIAADVSRRRIERLRENLARAGRGANSIIVADAARPPIRSISAYLLDAPCLGTGTFARHPDARGRVTETALQSLVLAQATLLDAAADRIAPGGVLCYATCSLEPEENEMQIAAFLARRRDFERQPPAVFPRDVVTPAGDLLTLPQRDGIDGAYAARLVRTA